MILIDSIEAQLASLTQKYPDLHIIECDGSQVRLYGQIRVFREANDFLLDKRYSVEIYIPLSTEELPAVKDVDNFIDHDYVHRYTNGLLCLETDTRIRLRFIDGLDLCAWMDEYVEPYYFSYEYFMRYGQFPFGERPHSFLGTIDTYQEILHCNNITETVKLITFAEQKVYRGHILCPCQSGKKLRSCHGRYLYPFMADIRLQAILRSDLNNIRTEYRKYEKATKDTRKTK